MLGIGGGDHFIAGDASSAIGVTDKIIYLADHQLAGGTADRLRVSHREQGHIRQA